MYSLVSNEEAAAEFCLDVSFFFPLDHSWCYRWFYWWLVSRDHRVLIPQMKIDWAEMLRIFTEDSSLEDKCSSLNELYARIRFLFLSRGWSVNFHWIPLTIHLRIWQIKIWDFFAYLIIFSLAATPLSFFDLTILFIILHYIPLMFHSWKRTQILRPATFKLKRLSVVTLKHMFFMWFGEGMRDLKPFNKFFMKTYHHKHITRIHKWTICERKGAYLDSIVNMKI